MVATSFIAVFRPHQRPAWAEVYDSEESFCDAWVNGRFARSCNAEPAGDDQVTFDAAWETDGAK
ncbi:MAG: hypothetical protein ACREA9_17440 [Pyrinomonadaceae bacterium]